MIKIYEKEPPFNERKTVNKVYSINIHTDKGEIIIIPNDNTTMTFTTEARLDPLLSTYKKQSFEITGDYTNMLVIE